MALTAQQKKLLKIGVPAVALVAVVVLVQRKKTAPAAGAIPGTAGTTPVDIGQLADYEQGLSRSVASLSADVNSQIAAFFARASSSAQINNGGGQTPTPSSAPSPMVATSPAYAGTNFAVNDPASNPLVSPAPPVVLNAGDALPDANGIGQRYILPGGDHTVVYG